MEAGVPDLNVVFHLALFPHQGSGQIQGREHRANESPGAFSIDWISNRPSQRPRNGHSIDCDSFLAMEDTFPEASGKWSKRESFESLRIFIPFSSHLSSKELRRAHTVLPPCPKLYYATNTREPHSGRSKPP